MTGFTGLNQIGGAEEGREEAGSERITGPGGVNDLADRRHCHNERIVAVAKHLGRLTSGLEHADRSGHAGELGPRGIREPSPSVQSCLWKVPESPSE